MRDFDHIIFILTAHSKVLKIVYNNVYTISIRAGVEGEKYCKRKETDWGRKWFIQGEKGVVYV